MVQATLSIMGLYNYDSTVLDGLVQNLPKAAKIPVDDVHVVGQDLNAANWNLHIRIQMLLGKLSQRGR